MIVWRIARKPYQALDGKGAQLYGGRWNSEGRAVVYTSATLSLAALELLVHLEPLLAPDDLIAMEIEVPESGKIGAQADASQFPEGWREYPSPEWQAELGDTWVSDGTFLWLAVPSAIVPRERNILINPTHARMSEVRVLSTQPFAFDKRLL